MHTNTTQIETWYIVLIEREREREEKSKKVNEVALNLHLPHDFLESVTIFHTILLQNVKLTQETSRQGIFNFL